MQINLDDYINLDLERAILSSCLIDEEAYVSIAGSIEASDFSLKEHQEIFNAIIKCSNSGEPISLSFVQKYINIPQNIINEITSTSSMIDIIAYVDELKSNSVKRKLLSFANKIPSFINKDSNISEISDIINKKLFEITNKINSSDVKNLSLIVSELLEEFARQKAQENKSLVGLDTGFYKLNKLSKGFKGGELIILAARPGMGKTTLALNFIEKTLENNHAVVFFSLEMPGIQILQRMLSTRTRISLQKILDCDLNDIEWEQIAHACNHYNQKKLFVHDSGHATVMDIRASLRKLIAQGEDIKLCVVDYIGLMMSHSKFSDRHLQVSEISRGLKLLARELNIPIIALSQLNRSLESRSNKRPMLSDLRESGAIEQDADMILFVYREEEYRRNETMEQISKQFNEGKITKEEYEAKKPKYESDEVAEIILGKNRNGPIDSIKVVFLKEVSCFEDRFMGKEEEIVKQTSVMRDD